MGNIGEEEDVSMVIEAGSVMLGFDSGKLFCDSLELVKGVEDGVLKVGGREGRRCWGGL